MIGARRWRGSRGLMTGYGVAPIRGKGLAKTRSMKPIRKPSSKPCKSAKGKIERVGQVDHEVWTAVGDLMNIPVAQSLVRQGKAKDLKEALQLINDHMF